MRQVLQNWWCRSAEHEGEECPPCGPAAGAAALSWGSGLMTTLLSSSLAGSSRMCIQAPWEPAMRHSPVSGLASMSMTFGSACRQHHTLLQMQGRLLKP